MVIVADIDKVIATYNQDESDEKCVSKSERHVELSETHIVVVHSPRSQQGHCKL